MSSNRSPALVAEEMADDDQRLPADDALPTDEPWLTLVDEGDIKDIFELSDECGATGSGVIISKAGNLPLDDAFDGFGLNSAQQKNELEMNQRAIERIAEKINMMVDDQVDRCERV
jgi:hypothetical protein